MKKTISGIALSVCTLTAFAANWHVYYEDAIRKDYVDAAGIVQKGSYLQSWSRIAFTEPQIFNGPPANGAVYKSAMQMALFNCAEREMYISTATYFSGDSWDRKMVAAENPAPNEKPYFRAVAPDSIGEGWLDYVCNAKKGKSARK